MEPLRLIEVYRASNSIEACFIRDALVQAGIRAQIEGEWPAMENDFSSAIMWEFAPRLMVSEADSERARELLLHIKAEA